MEPVFPFDLVLPGRGQGPLTQSLHDQLRAAIVGGRLIAGAELPASRRVAEALGISRNTVVAAYDLLVAEGYALPRRGAKATVADIAPRRVRAAIATARSDSRILPVWFDPLLRRDPPKTLPAQSFRLGIPDHRYFPHALWRRLSAQALRAASKTPFAYPPSEGIPALREAIAQHVAFARAVACQSGDIVVTTGAHQAFDMLARLFVRPGKTRVAVEEPGYPPVRAAFLAAGAELVPVAVDDEGLRVDRLPTDVRIVCVTPSHQSPTGVTMSLARRRALLDFARARNAVVIEDDYDGEFRFGGRPLDALQTLDRDVVFYVGTFSKSLFPAIRRGFVVTPAWAREALITAKHCVDSHCDATAQATLAAFIREGHLARHVRRMRGVYAARREALLDGLRSQLSPWLTPISSEAGLHLAARINNAKDAPRLFAAARECVPGAQSIAEYAMGRIAQPALTFGYGVIDADAIMPSLMKLRAALRRG